jgi:hypothetical protein
MWSGSRKKPARLVKARKFPTVWKQEFRGLTRVA